MFKRHFFSTILFSFLLLFFAQTPISATNTVLPRQNGSSGDDLATNLAKQAELEQKIADAKNQQNTLANEISRIDNQIELTNLQIEATDNKLTTLNETITITTQKLADANIKYTKITTTADTRIRQIYKESFAGPLDLLLGSRDVNSFLLRQKYADSVHKNDVQLMTEMKNLKDSIAQTKASLDQDKQDAEDLKSSLVSKQNALENQTRQKENLLTATKNNEANYQSQLATAKAEEQALLAFANTRVGSGGSILSHSNLSDSWGKYYNQRDSYWGNIIINNSGYQIWEVGCLLTSVAMVFSHYGYNDITPGIVGANPANFWGSTSYMLIPGPVPPGHSESYVNYPSLSYIQSAISAGNAVILGMAWGANQHWVVARGLASGGGILINDPWYFNAMNVPLTNNYSFSYVFAARIFS